MYHKSVLIVTEKAMNDTNKNAQEIQIKLLQQATVAKRLKLLGSLSSTTIRLSKRAISRNHNQLSKRDLDIQFVRLHYGDELADRLKKYLGKYESV